MLDLDRLRRIHLFRTPPGQLVMANTFLAADYRIPRRTRIKLEGIERLDPNARYIFAMNHTDRFNYWPFQWQLYREGRGFTATWVKGKYYENEWIARFMDVMNNIPLPSRGYVISSRFKQQTRRPPTGDEYRMLRDIVDGKIPAHEPLPATATADIRAFIGGPTAADFLPPFEAEFAAMIREVVRLSRRAIEIGNHLLIFPEGTRSVRLGKGRTGLAQVACHLGVPIVPVGCNGSNVCYPGDSPFSKGGSIVYRIGAPLPIDGPDLAPHAVDPAVLPFTRDASANHADTYQAFTDAVMAKIAELLDPAHLPVEGAKTEVTGVERFL